MRIKLAVVMDPIAEIHPEKDSTLAMLLEAKQRRWDLYYIEQKDLFLKNGKVYANTQVLEVFKNLKKWFSLSSPTVLSLNDFDILLMRKDPPFNLEYIYTTHLLEIAENQGLCVVNKPQSLRDANEKIFATWFPECCPPTLVTRNSTLLHDFVEEHQKVVFKPLDSMGGRSIFLVQKQDVNTQVIIDTLTQLGSQFMMVQKFIPEISHGDKRILLINGEPVPYGLARIPAQGEIRGNLAAGGHGIGVKLTENDLLICKKVGPVLKKKGLVFVGIDVIGNYLTEINVTSPTCIREIDAAFGTNISRLFCDSLENILREKMN